MAAHSEIELSSALDKYVDDDILSILLRYSLFVGAIFQLVCIFSSILLPVSKGTSENDDGDSNEEYKPPTGSGRLQKFRKQEKKKRR